jgi:CDP-diacylglycerol--serine O-phosphatidyltransferase
MSPLDPIAEQRKRSRAAYALPTFFTAGNIFLGFLSIMKSFQGAMLVASGDTGENPHWRLAALAIGWAFVVDGLDGRIARMTQTVSDFGREMDSLADVVTFGLAPAVLAFSWGIYPAFGSLDLPFRGHLQALGFFVPFLFLLCGAARLARFNIQKNPVPKNPGRPDRKYFVGLPIPAAAALVAAFVFAARGVPVANWRFSLAWLALLAVLSFLMVSTWRYRSFKDMQLLRPRSPLIVIAIGSFIYALWEYTEAALLALSITYTASGAMVRFGGILRRRANRRAPEPEHQIG